MSEVKISQEKLITGFMDVFRKAGYDGASLGDLADASGLKKSSLYHRFPGGKEQMAMEVLNYVEIWVLKNLTQVLINDSDPRIRLDKALKNISELYEDGNNGCILRALSMDSGLQSLNKKVNSIFDSWIKGFSKLARDFGHDRRTSIILSEDVLIKVQGSLLIGSGGKENTYFKRALAEIKSSFIS